MQTSTSIASRRKKIEATKDSFFLPVKIRLRGLDCSLCLPLYVKCNNSESGEIENLGEILQGIDIYCPLFVGNLDIVHGPYLELPKTPY